MKRIMLCLMLVAVLAATGCAKLENRIDADGGFFGSYPGNYIVRNDSGGKIMDVWILKNVIVQSEAQSDGWLFKDGAGNMINLGGDVKVIRVKDSNEMEKYHEYHAEFEKLSYQELHCN